jgi:hypothetical protein
MRAGIVVVLIVVGLAAGLRLEYSQAPAYQAVMSRVTPGPAQVEHWEAVPAVTMAPAVAATAPPAPPATHEPTSRNLKRPSSDRHVLSAIAELSARSRFKLLEESRRSAPEQTLDSPREG